MTGVKCGVPYVKIAAGGVGWGPVTAQQGGDLSDPSPADCQPFAMLQYLSVSVYQDPPVSWQELH